MEDEYQNRSDNAGSFVISLDFELLWGVRDIMGPAEYGKEIKGVFDIFPKMLALFDQYDVKATFATVGFLFAESKSELNTFLPTAKPAYNNPNLSPYNGHMNLVGENETEDRYHYATSLMEILKEHPDQEVGTHTFSHYYCLSPGQTSETFRADLYAAKKIASAKGFQIKSLVFPRNQANAAYMKICRELGIESYRGNEQSWFYNTANRGKGITLFGRGLRLLDTYVNISGHNTYESQAMATSELPFNLPSSRFLRPYNKKLKALEELRLQRITKSMQHAAKKGEMYHLWWHPHNFGVHQNENLNFLERILKTYKKLQESHGFRNLTMGQLAKELGA